VQRENRRVSAGLVLSISLLVVLTGHVVGAWSIPKLGAAATPRAGDSLDRTSISVAYSRLTRDGVSPWSAEATQQIMSRFVERWAEATLGRSRLRLLEETEVRDVLVVFSNQRVVSGAEARQVSFAGGRLRYIEVFAPNSVLGVDVEYTAGTLLHETGHALGCCSGPGTVGGHFVGSTCMRILCSPHGQARTFTEEELQQMALGR
jgi:hypothetical protein